MWRSDCWMTLLKLARTEPALFHLNLRFNYQHSSLEPMNRLYQGGWEFGFPLYWEQLFQFPFLKMETTASVCQSRGTFPKHHAMLQKHVKQDSSATSRALRISSLYHYCLTNISIISFWTLRDPGHSIFKEKTKRHLLCRWKWHPTGLHRTPSLTWPLLRRISTTGLENGHQKRHQQWSFCQSI